MSAAPRPRKDPFVRRASLDGAAGAGARWWNDAMEVDRSVGIVQKLIARRDLLIGLGVSGGVLAMVAVPLILENAGSDEVEGSMDALELQRRTSWNVGELDRSLVISDAVTLDTDGGTLWRVVLGGGGLTERLAPPEARLKPFYASTLFQALDDRAGLSLRQQVVPIFNPSMQEAYDRGLALAAMFEGAGRPRDTALVIDLPGPEAVAAAAALAELFAPVFTFDNWPHPRGVVPSHRTLGAALYYLPRFEGANAARPRPAPPAFVLDANRLAPYRDEASEFDNRYVASLPSIDSLGGLGVKRIMYVGAHDVAQELDDLNTDLAALDAAGISVRGLAMDDFTRDAAAQDGQPGQPTGGAPDGGSGSTGTARATHHRYHYGSGGGHVVFWHQYGWYETSAARGPRPPAAPFASTRSAAYRPAPRATMFSSRAVGGIKGIGIQKPSGFGRVSIRSSPSTGSISVGRGRSGSFGRGFSSSG